MTETLTPELNHYLTLFREREDDYRAGASSWLHPVRKAAISRFLHGGFPTLRNEEWLYTNVASVVSRSFVDGSSAGFSKEDVARYSVPNLAEHRLVFVDGRFSSELSQVGTLPEGVRFEPLAEALQDASLRSHLGAAMPGDDDGSQGPRADEAFQHLNSAFFENGVCFAIGEGKKLERPVEVLYLSSGADDRVSYPRNLFIAEPGSEGSIVEVYGGPEVGAYQTNAMTEVFVGSGAHLEHTKIVREGAEACHFAAQRTRQQRESRYATRFFSFAGKLVRNEITFCFEGEQADGIMDGLYLIDGDRHVDNHTFIHHAEPNCHSREVYKGVIGDRARGVFTGKIHVHPDAQKTDAEQSNDALLLSPDATVNTRPRLEIYADDVRCTHGATVGELDEDALFYLRARGIPKAEAKTMLTRAFAGAVVEEVENPALRAQLEELFVAALPEAVEA